MVVVVCLLDVAHGAARRQACRPSVFLLSVKASSSATWEPRVIFSLLANLSVLPPKLTPALPTSVHLHCPVRYHRGRHLSHLGDSGALLTALLSLLPP